MSKRFGNELVTAAAIFTFDISLGDTVECRHPPGAVLPLPTDELSALAVPEGGHLVEEDHVYILTKDPNSGEQLYGLAYFHRRVDPSAPRGALMKSLLLLARRPYFSSFLPLLQLTLVRYMDTSDASVLSTLVTGLNGLVKSAAGPESLSLWGSAPQPVDMAKLAPDVFGGASLLALVRHFREDSMLLWWSILLQQRVLFVGQPAGAVGACCLAAPLLVAPLTGFAEIITPYVPLAFPNAVLGVAKGGRFICGATNGLFAERRDWYDTLASYASGSVTVAAELKVKVPASQRAFIKNVLAGIERDGRSDAWVRQQFRQLTEAHLLELHMSESGARKPTAPAVCHREMYRLAESAAFKAFVDSWGEQQQEAPRQADAAHHYYDLLLAHEAEGLQTTHRLSSAGEASKLLFNMHASLCDLSEIDRLVNEGAARRLSSDAYLKHESAQVRKYATQVLATLCSTIRGQIAVLSCGLLPKFASMLTDVEQMHAVRIAAASCLHKTASMLVGCQALLAAGIVDDITSLLIHPMSHGELLLPTLLAATLLQVYRYLPDAPRTEGAEKSISAHLKSPTLPRDLALLLMQLLDEWGVPLSADTPRIAGLLIEAPQILLHVDSLAADGLEAKVDATAALRDDLSESGWLAVPLVLAGAIEALAENALLQEQPTLARSSVLSLAILADTRCGRARLLGKGCHLLPSLVAALASPSVSPTFGYAVSRLLEVVAQEAAGAEWVATHATKPLVAFAKEQAQGSADHALLALPALGALRCVLLERPAERATAMQAELKPLLSVGEASDPRAHEALTLVLDIAGLLRGGAGRDEASMRARRTAGAAEASLDGGGSLRMERL